MQNAFHVNGVSYSLTHLAPSMQRTNARLGDNAAADSNLKCVPVEVNYSSHCWSRLPKVGESISQGWLVPEGPRHDPMVCRFQCQVCLSVKTAAE